MMSLCSFWDSTVRLLIPWRTTAAMSRRQVGKGGGACVSKTYLSCAKAPLGFTRWRAPVCRRACHLPKRRQDKLGKNTAAFRGNKKRKCKYFKRCVPLHHCWLCLILWASANNGRWDSFFGQTPKRKSRKHCYLWLCLYTVCSDLDGLFILYIRLFISLRPLLKLDLIRPAPLVHNLHQTN